MARDIAEINKQKKSTLERLFEDDWMLIHVDTRAEQVVVPDHLKGSPSITFKISKLFQGVTEIKNGVISAQLLFGNARHACIFPYDSIWGATSFKGSNIVWPESAPPEVLEQIDKMPTEIEMPPSEQKEKSPKRKDREKPTHLKRIK